MHSGDRLALIVPDTDEPTAERLAAEVAGELHDRFRAQTASSSRRPGDTGDAVVYRARDALGDE